jgi:putative ABC transport system permease protein
MIHLLHEIRRAARNLIHTPGFTLPALLVLALGLGAGTAVFGALRTILLSTPPYPDADRIVWIFSEVQGMPGSSMPASWPEYVDYQSGLRTLECVGGSSDAAMNLTGIDAPCQVKVAQITPEFLRVYGVRPLIGSLVWDRNAERGAILSEAFWRRQMGGDASVIGRSVVLDGVTHPIQGVLPAAAGLGKTDVFIPLVPRPEVKEYLGNHFLPLKGRLRPGMTAAQAAAELDARCEARFKAVQAGAPHTRYIVRPLIEARRNGDLPVLKLLGLAAGLVLVIMVVNLAGQFLARALSRTEDTAIRLSLGANLVQTLRPGFLEALVLALGGALLGLIVGVVAMTLIRHLLSPSLLAYRPLALDGQALGFAVALGITVSLLVSVLPSLMFVWVSPAQVLKEAGHRTTRGAARWVRPTLVVVQVGLALAILTSFSLLVTNLVRLRRVPLGFKTEGVAVFSCRTSFRDDAGWAKANVQAEQVLERLRAMPGVESAGSLAPFMPIEGCGFNGSMQVKGKQLSESDWFEIRQASPQLFRTLGLPLLKGRDFEPGDYLAESTNVIVSESAARLCWPGQDPIGQSISRDGEHWMRVVGLVADARNAGPMDDWANKTVYFPDRVDSNSTAFAVRFKDPSHMDLAGIRALMGREAPDWPVAGLKPMRSLVEENLESLTILVELLGLATLLALGLALVGLHGTLGYHVLQRTRELGIRFALGATRAQVFRSVVLDGLRLAGMGCVLGAAGAWAGVRILETQIPKGGRMPLFLFLACVPLLLVCAVLAALQPAIAASRVEPAEALRNE